MPDMIIALRTKKIDGFLVDMPTANLLRRTIDDLAYVNEELDP